MGAFKKFFKDWQDGAGGGAQQRPGEHASDIGRMTNVWDPRTTSPAAGAVGP